MFNKNITFSISIALLLCLSLPVFATAHFHPDHLKQFNETGQCPHCDLSGIKFLTTLAPGPLNLQGAILIRSSLHSAASQRQFSDFSNVVGTEFIGVYVDFSYSSFANSKLNGAELRGSNLAYSDFTNATVIGVSFTNCILYKAKITPQQLATALSICDAILPDGSRGPC